MKALIRFLKENRGTSSIEMGLICALVVLAILSALEFFAETSVSMWDTISTRASEASNKSGN